MIATTMTINVKMKILLPLLLIVSVMQLYCCYIVSSNSKLVLKGGHSSCSKSSSNSIISGVSSCFPLYSSKGTDDDDKYLGSLWKDRVQYIDLAANNQEESLTSRTLPLFLLSGAFYPEGETYLNIFEMRYRTMMYDCANNDDVFGYIHTDQRTGSIATVGTLCKIVDRQLLSDGRQYIALEGVSRFKVRKILKTLPYISAEVECNYVDELPLDANAEAALIKLERDVYDSLKYYMRLMKSNASYKDMVVSPACKRNRPLRNKAIDLSVNPSSKEENERRTKFSFALANMIQMTQSQESQLLLQTTNLYKRLEAEKLILQQASEIVSQQLIKSNELTADARDGLKMRSFNNDYDDDDILPADEVEEAPEAVKDEWDINNIM